MTIDDQIAALVVQRDALPVDGQLPMAITHDEQTALVEKRRVLDLRILRAKSAAAKLAAIESDETDVRWRDFLTTARKTLCDELLTIRSPIRDPKILGRAENLRLSIRAIDRGSQVFEGAGWSLENSQLGALMITAGYERTAPDPRRNYSGELPWHGSLSDVEKRLADRADKRRAAQAALDEALLDEETRAMRDAESAALRNTFNAMHVRIGPHGLVAFKDDGDELSPSDMTDLQRAAFERIAATFR